MMEAPALPRIDPAATSVAAAPRRVLMLGTNPDMRGGVASVVATLRDAGLFERCGVEFVSTHVDGTRGAKVRQFVDAWRRTLRALRSRRFGLVHAHVSSRGSFWRKAMLLWLARRFGVSTIFHLHDGTFAEFAATGFGGPLLRWCIRRTLESSTAVVALAPRWGEWVAQFAPRSRVSVIGNPVKCPDSVARPRGDANAPQRILFLGKVCREKGVFDLLDAFAVFAKTHPDWRLAIGGHGEIDEWLARADTLGVRSRVESLGWVSGARKDDELRRADVFVLPSYGEGMPVSVLEAMAFGAAVITTPVGGVPDMMRPDVHGLWFEPGDVPALTRCLQQLADSPQRRLEFGDAARRHVLERYSVPIVIAQLCEVYDRALAGRGR